MQRLFLLAFLCTTAFAQQDILAGLGLGDLNLTRFITGSQIKTEVNSVTEQLLQEEIDDLKKDLVKTENDLKDARVLYGSKINTLVGLIKKQLATTKAHEGQISSLNGQVKTKQDTNDQLNVRLADLKALYDELQKNFRNFKVMHAAEVQKLSGLIQNCTGDLSVTTRTLQSTQSVLSNWVVKNAENRQTIDDLNANLAAVKGELTVCNADLTQCQSDKLATEQQLMNCTTDGTACEADLVDSQDAVMNLTARLSNCESRGNQWKQQVATRDQLISQLRGDNNNLENSRDFFNGSYIDCQLNVTYHMNLVFNQALQIANLDKERAEYEQRAQNCSSDLTTERSLCKTRDVECKKTEAQLLHCEGSLNQTTRQLQMNIERKVKYQKESSECFKSLQNCSLALNGTQQDLSLVKLELDTCKVQKDLIEDNAANCTTERQELEKQLNTKLPCQKNMEQKSKQKFQKNCEVWLVDLKMPPGRYRIDPDGEGKGVDAFEVHCTIENGQVLTKVPHDPKNQLKDVVKSNSSDSCDIKLSSIASQNRYRGDKTSKDNYYRKFSSRWSRWSSARKTSAQKTSAPRSSVCSVVNVEYEVSQEQFNALKNASKSCKQVVTWQCVKQIHLAVFYSDESKPSTWTDGKSRFISWLKSLIGQDLKYSNFHPSSSQSCDCAGNCQPVKKRNCACYANDDKLQTDTITITDKNNLPVQKLALGDLDDDDEKGSAFVGDLICY